MKIFFDLDGTLIDVSKRHYAVYSETIRDFNGEPISRAEYWELKRKKTAWPAILLRSNISINIEKEFLKFFISRIEDPAYLKMDTLFPGAIDVLQSSSKNSDIYLVSLRRNRENLLEEINNLDIGHYFTKVLTGHSETDGYDKKIELIKDIIGTEEGLIIGDTEADIITGKTLELLTLGLTTGIRDEQFLAALDPDYLSDDITFVENILQPNN